MSDLIRAEPSQLELAAEAGIRTAARAHGHFGAGTIVIHLGPGKSPEYILLERSAWKTVTALNFAEGREFHMRLRTNGRHFVVYGSIHRLDTGTVMQRGFICRSMVDVERCIPTLRKELGLDKPGLLKP